MDMKTCLKCGVEKEYHHFRKCSHGLFGVVSVCKDCCKDNYTYRNPLYYKIEQEREKSKRSNKPVDRWVSTFYHIKHRCENPANDSWKSYGGRGIRCLITIAELKVIWLRDRAYEMVRPSIDRIDNDGNYCFENCRYIERRENSLKSNKKDYVYNPSFLGYEHTIIT
jgi:hypothetical protein